MNFKIIFNDVTIERKNNVNTGKWISRKLKKIIVLT